MADSTDVLLKFVEQQWIEAKQAEDQRSIMTNIILVIVAAIIGFIAQKGLNNNVLFLSILLIILGLYGAIVSAKLYERHQFHISRLTSWRKKIDELNPDTKLEALKSEANISHYQRFPVIKKIKLYYLWMALHLMIAFGGVILTVIIIFFS
ncbi:hypothetical protein [Thiothrix unzii]|uniref:Uncharacterized protein n=1 Tax=Thiothrix unzii TaxID=111769 RepID=A0A975F910_9GAMM|nr:hypothetical protein [Thiothrix unzii]QTR53199.1 hypothetical protein J9260_16065 [Thiothrix unzii]